MLKCRANWRGAGAVERAGLENRYTRKRIVGSNPTLSANESAAFPIILRDAEKLDRAGLDITTFPGSGATTSRPYD